MDLGFSRDLLTILDNNHSKRITLPVVVVTSLSRKFLLKICRRIQAWSFLIIPNINSLTLNAETSAATCIKHLSNWIPAVEEIRSWLEYEPQPLRGLPHAANRLNIGALFVKDESRRFGKGIGASKALGAPYSVFKILQKEVHNRIGMHPSAPGFARVNIAKSQEQSQSALLRMETKEEDWPMEQRYLAAAVLPTFTIMSAKVENGRSQILERS